MIEILQNYFAQAPAFGWNAFWISQLLVIGVVICNLSAYQFKHRSQILVVSMMASVFLSSHFFLLEQTVAASITGLAIIRKVFAYIRPGPQLLIVFLFISSFLTFYLFEAWYNLLAWLAVALISISNFKANDYDMRLWQMAGTTTWITHNIIIFSPMGVLTEILFLLSNLFGFYRFYIKK